MTLNAVLNVNGCFLLSARGFLGLKGFFGCFAVRCKCELPQFWKFFRKQGESRLFFYKLFTNFCILFNLTLGFFDSPLGDEDAFFGITELFSSRGFFWDSAEGWA